MRAVLVVLALALGGCASPYGPQGIAGGFQEDKLAANVYRVAYNGNGYTSEEQVVSYWLYRCAELTLQNGYSYFGMVPEGSRPVSMRDESAGSKRMAVFRPGDNEPRMQNVAYVYVPSFTTTTVRTWHKQGTIAMYHSRLGSVIPEQANALHARTVVDKLGEYVKSGAKIPAPPRQEVIDAALHYAPNLNNGAVQDLPETVVRPTK
jgi:hypothetical protein